MTTSVAPTQRETLALGWLSAEMARRADAWSGNAPEWFPEPPEWLELWEAALTGTEQELLGELRKEING